MNDNSPILVIDYCSVADKYDFLGSLAAALAPRPVIVADGFRGRRVYPTNVGDGHLSFVSVPRTVYQRRSVTDFFQRPPSIPDMDEERFALLIDHLKTLTRERHAKFTDALAGRNLVAAHRFATKLLRLHSPALTVVWNQFHPLSLAAEAAARAEGCPIAYIEYGLLPGALTFDFLGQMGESAVAVNGDAFDALPIDAADREAAATAVERLKASRASRRHQPHLFWEADHLRNRAGGRPIVLYAGHNDHSSGMVPYDARARELHSPLFVSSAQAAEFLAEEAARRGWFVVYKPHPFALRSQTVAETEHLAVIGKADINDCIDVADCVVTVLSQTSYISLIREKPLVMLGYNQLRGHGCNYEAATLDDVGQTIHDALIGGFTQDQRNAWEAHVARLLKYYQYRYRGSAPVLDLAATALALAEKIEAAIATGLFVDFRMVEPVGERDETLLP